MAVKKIYLDWKESAEKVSAIIRDKSLPLWKKGHLVGGAYAGIALEGLQ